MSVAYIRIGIGFIFAIWAILLFVVTLVEMLEAIESKKAKYVSFWSVLLFSALSYAFLAWGKF